MNRSILMAALLAGTALFALPAQANIVLDELIFADLGGTGFGSAPRLLTLQRNSFEAGGTIAGAGGTTQLFYGGVPTLAQTACTSNQTCAPGGVNTGTNESKVYSVGALGWNSGAQVGIGLDTDQQGILQGSAHPLTFGTLTLTLYNNAGVALGSFSGSPSPPGVDISVALLAQQQGNGNSVFNLGLDAAQQAQYDAIINNPLNGGVNNIYEGLRASFGCGIFGAAVCNTTGNWESNDGPDSFLAFVQVPGPVVGAGIPGVVAACSALFGLNFWRRRRSGANLPA
jgi:hypothetical protein